MSKIWFVSSNEHKFGEARRILGRMGMEISHHRASLPEVQSHSLEEIALAKAASARSLVGGAVLVEDDGLFIDSLKGFPGPYSSYVFDTIGNAGILALVRGDRAASFRSVGGVCGRLPHRGLRGGGPGPHSRRRTGLGMGVRPRLHTRRRRGDVCPDRQGPTLPPRGGLGGLC